MPVRVQLPPGCESLKFPGSKPYYGKPGGSVVVADEHAAQIRTSGNGQLGIISGRMTAAVGTRAGRWCAPCRFLAQAWSTSCPRCGAETTEETTPAS
jgi:hypothetical protein